MIFSNFALHFILIVGLECEICSGFGTLEQRVCTKQLCTSGMDRCIVMTYTTEGQAGWVKDCSNQYFCGLTDSQACVETNKYYAGAIKINNCKKTCTSSKIIDTQGKYRVLI